jgi:hypothetical protein
MANGHARPVAALDAAATGLRLVNEMPGAGQPPF